MIRIGLLAASRIAGKAVAAPAAGIEGVEVTTVAARSAERAAEAAAKLGLPRSFGSYRELIDCDDIDAVYIATPAALHRPWAVAALDAGKHILCEKPLAANADDGRRIAEAAERSDAVAMEAYHWRYHPLADQIRSVVDSGEVGRLERVEARFDLVDGRVDSGDIRWDLALGGGAMMDLGCYPLQWVRFVVGADPHVVAARADCPVDGVDGRLEADLSWPADDRGVTGWIHCSMMADKSVTNLVVTGSDGTLRVDNPLSPQNGARFVVESAAGHREEPVAETTTYHHQLVAFRDAIMNGTAFPTTMADGVRTMAAIDECYRAAGLEPRPSSP